MRRLLGVSLLLLSCLGHAAPMGFDEARHLLNRTGFSASEQEVQAYAKLSREQAVNRLLADGLDEARTPPPAWVNEPFSPPPKLKELNEEQRKAQQDQERERSIELRGWWYREMLTTPSPLTEKMTLFWHNHFVSGQQKVKSLPFLYRQNVLLRRYALGNFGEMLHAVARDPAMVMYLDNVSNRKGKPNENFAREVMELFTLGVGHYGEQDIREAARAFTGWSLDRDTGTFRIYPRQHDDGSKTVLGQTGDLDGDGVLDILLQQPATAEFITAKLWKEFISPNPDPKAVKRLAKVFRDSRYEIRPLLRAMLTSPEFYAKANRGVLVKSPVELLVGTLRQFDLQPADLRPVLLSARRLGQDVFNPPNVKGWPGGNSWINSDSLLERRQVLERLFRAQEMPRGKAGGEMADYRFDSGRWLGQFKGALPQRREAMARLLLPLPPAAAVPPDMDGLALVRVLALDPAYQLK